MTAASAMKSTRRRARSFQKELADLTSAIASINAWNRFGAAFRWTPPQRKNAA
jgi:alkylhydroperoxidase family enzyme